jgi:uncharacterized membrane protein YphA (DoxX/SURF4 family)
MPARRVLSRFGCLRGLDSGYSSGLVGVGLLVLRLALFHWLGAAGQELVVAGLMSASTAAGAALSLVGTVVGGAALLLAFGVVARSAAFVGALAMLVALVDEFWRVGIAFADGARREELVLGTALALGVALIGPGAYSVDAWLFGRREISIPPRPQPPTR